MNIQGLFGQSANDLIGVLGEVDAMQVIVKLGGISVIIPPASTAKQSPWWGLFVAQLGEGLTTKFIHFFGGQRFTIPRCKLALNALRNQEITQEYEALCRAGFEVRPALSALSVRYRLSGTQIWKIVNQ